MTTIKITKKPSETPTASKTPVRRADITKRDRSVAPPKVAVPARETKDAESTPQAPKTSQRNHRFDGKAHGSPYAEQVLEDRPSESKPGYNRPSENRPAKSELSAEVPRDSKQTEPKQHKPAGVDTRITPRPDKNEPQYRQAPRRGGKVRDGYDAVSTPQYGAAAKAA